MHNQIHLTDEICPVCNKVMRMQAEREEKKRKVEKANLENIARMEAIARQERSAHREKKPRHKKALKENGYLRLSADITSGQSEEERTG